MSTRKTLLQYVATELGGQRGNIGSGTATTAVLTEIAGVYPDDEHNGAALVMPDAATAADQERLVTDYTGSSGTATFATRADTTYTSETWHLIPKGVNRTLNEQRIALNNTLRSTPRACPLVVATEEGEYVYRLPASWLERENDILGVHYRGSPNVVDNEGFEKWQNGTSSAPDSFTLSGAGGTVARTSSFALGKYAAQLTRSGTDTFLTYALPWSLVLQLRGKEFVVGAQVECGTASRAQVKLDDGVATATDVNASTGFLEWVEATQTISASATKIEVSFGVVTGDVAAICARLVGVEGSSVPDTLKDYGSTGYPLQEVTHTKNVGAVTLQTPKGRGGQLVVYTKRTFAELSADSGTTDCPDNVAVAGAMYRLAKARKHGDDRSRLDVWEAKHGAAYGQLAPRLLLLPVPRPQRQMLVRGL